MKYTLILAALLGYLSCDQVSQVQAVEIYKHKAAKPAAAASSSSDSSSSSSSSSDAKTSKKSLLMLDLEDDEEVDHSGEFFEAAQQGTGMLDNIYERVPPA